MVTELAEVWTDYTAHYQLFIVDFIARIAKQKIVILGNGEFDGEEWVKFIESKKWEYVLRTSLERKVSHMGDTFPISQSR